MKTKLGIFLVFIVAYPIYALPFVQYIPVDIASRNENEFYKLSRIHGDGEVMQHEAYNYHHVLLSENYLEILCQNNEIKRTKPDTKTNFCGERSDYENTYSVGDTQDDKNTLTRINDGLKIVIQSIRRILRNLLESINNYLIRSFVGCIDGTSLHKPRCWVFPTTILASVLLARDQICQLGGNNFIGCAVTRNVTELATTEGPCVPTVSSNNDATCTCVNFQTAAGDGDCVTSSPAPNHCGASFCYVDVAISTCLDLAESTVIPGLFYSAQACLL